MLQTAQQPHPRAEPFIKWAGGKSQLLKQFDNLFPKPDSYTRYIEPFVGGGAVFFHLQPKNAIIADLNASLMNCYEVIKTDLNKLIYQLTVYKAEHSKEFFLELRSHYNSTSLSKIERAAAFIYLNKTAFNGLYRENSKGQFNVPFGRYNNPAIFTEPNLKAVSSLLKNTVLITGSYEIATKNAQKGDFIYLDPPYFPVNETAYFTSYTKKKFLKDEQIALAKEFVRLHKKGCLVMLSNSDVPFIRELYEEYQKQFPEITLHTVQAKRSINSNATKRGPVTELVVRNYS